MKTILTSVLVLLLITSCDKKECEMANQQVQNKVYELQNAIHQSLILNTDQSYNEVGYAKQELENTIRMRDNVCN